MKYRAIHRVSWDAGEELDAGDPRTITVHEDDEPKDTGLLDANGTPIYRVRERVPFGFVR